AIIALPISFSLYRLSEKTFARHARPSGPNVVSTHDALEFVGAQSASLGPVAQLRLFVRFHEAAAIAVAVVFGYGEHVTLSPGAHTKAAACSIARSMRDATAPGSFSTRRLANTSASVADENE
ncbi:MAG TPA: hypothetical protein VIQ62_10330, partial [Burkholderiales bacterium]